MKRLFALLLSAALIALTAVSAGAVDYNCDIAPVTDAVYLENLNTGTVVFEKNADEKMYPASTTKTMTYIITAENVPDPENTMVEISASVLDALDPESSVMGLANHTGEKISVLDLLYGLMLPSGNDAAVVLADYVGHGISSFVDMMNQKAAQLGCANTHFVNPHGLFDERHYSTARDMAKIAKYARSKPYFDEITSSSRHVVRYSGSSDGETLYTTNYLIDATQEDGRYYYPYAKGIKTGYTDEAGRCLISRAEMGDYEYLCVALGAPYSYIEDINYAMLDSVDLYDWAFDNLTYTTVYSSADAVKTLDVGYVWGECTVDLVPESEIAALLPKDYDESLITARTESEPALYAPVEAGTKAGTLTVSYGDTVIGSVDLVTSESVRRDVTCYLAHKVVDFIGNNLLIVIFLVIIMILLIVLVSARNRRRRIERQRRRYRY